MHNKMMIALGALLLATPALGQENVVNVYNWSDYIAEDTVAKFEAETGIKVNYDVFDSNELVEAKLLAGSLPGIWVGSHLMSRTPERLIRSVLSLLLAYAGTKLVLL